MIFIHNNRIINQINHVPNADFLCFIKIVNNVVIIATNETNRPIGYTDHNLFSSLCIVKGFTDSRLVLAFHIKLSQKAKKTHSGINDNVIEKNKISARIFLFSGLFMLEKNIIMDIATHNSNQTKWKWYQYGFSISNKACRVLGIMVHWLFKKKYTYAHKIYVIIIATGNR